MGVFAGPEITESGLVLALDGANTKSYPTKNFVSSKIYSSFGSSIRSSNYTVQYSDDNSNWTTAFTGVASNNTSCGIQQNTGSGSGSYGLHRYWRYVEGSPIQSHHPRVSRIILTDINGIDYNLVVYTSDNCSDTGTYQVGTVSLDFGGTTWTDLSTNGNTGTLTNGPTYNSANGGSFVFDGSDDYVQISNNVSPGTGDFAISVWVYKTETVTNRYIWDFGANGGTLASGTSITQGFRYYNPSIGAGGSLYTAGPIHNINTWYNIVISRISGTTYFYSNGSLINSAADAGNIGSWGTTLYIGRYGGSGGYEHQGSISNFLVYKNKGLSAAEVSQNFNALRGRFGI